MTARGMSIVFAAAALISAAAGSACAADRPGRQVDFTVRSEPTTLADKAGRTYRYDASRGRFGFTLRMQEPETRPVTPNDVQAGAFFRITPSLQVGGSVAFGGQELTPRANPARPAIDAPKVRLESTLKF